MIYKRKIIIFLIHIFVFSSFINAQSTKIKDLENKRIQLKKEIKEINGLLIDNTKQAKMAYGDLENISIKINRNQDLIKINNQQINLLTSTIVKNERKVNQLKTDVDKEGLKSNKKYITVFSIFTSFIDWPEFTSIEINASVGLITIYPPDSSFTVDSKI